MKKIGVIFIILFLLPVLFTSLFGNLKKTATQDSVAASTQALLSEGRFQISNETEIGRENIPLELYVADKLARTMNGDWETEALKAQAILIRSELFWELKQNKSQERRDERDLANVGTQAAVEETENENILRIRDEGYGSKQIHAAIYQAAAETAGLCMTYKGEIVKGAYFAVSNGATRSGEEFALQGYPYLNSVLCSRDFLSEDYSSSVDFGKEEFIRIWETLSEVENALEKADASGTDLFMSETKLQHETAILHRDSVGYVIYIEWKDKCVSGEAFRKAFHIPSSSFHLSEEDKKIVIKSKGAGHGLGMSQFAANEMAKEKKTAQEILAYFFKDVTITKIE